MAKEKTAYVCTECGYDSAKWLGKCPACGKWDTFKEVKLGAPKNTKAAALVGENRRWASEAQAGSAVKRLRDVAQKQEERLDTRDPELNRVLGGGLVKGSLVLLGGEPGIGKSTLLLQTILGMSDRGILYVSGEESERQIKLRAERMATLNREGEEPYLLCESSLEHIFEQVKTVAPEILIVDSIQTMNLAEISMEE